MLAGPLDLVPTAYKSGEGITRKGQTNLVVQKEAMRMPEHVVKRR